MISRERVLMVLRHQQPDRVPYDINGFNREAFRLVKEKAGNLDPDTYFGVEKDVEWVEFKETKLDSYERFFKFHRLPENLKYAGDGLDREDRRPAIFSLNEWGTALVVGSDISYDHFVPPYGIVNAKSIKDIEEYPLSDITSEYRYRHLKEDVKKIKDKGLASVAGMACTIFEPAWQIRGFNELLTDFMTNEEWAACLLDRITVLSLFRAQKFAEAGVDIIHIGDDVGMEHKLMMSPATWEKWLKPRLAKIIKAAREIKPDVIFCYHSDGYVEPIIPDFIEIGINALDPIQPECMDPAKLKKEYGDKLAFWGTVGIQHTLPFGTPEDVRKEVKESIETVGKGGGLYLSPTHVLAPEVPHENIFAFVEAAKQYGKYT